jgi:predicted permease
VLSLLGLAGGTAAGVAGWLSPAMIVLSLLLLGYAFFVLYVRKRGTRVSTAITWTSALFVAGYWTWRIL